MLVVAIGVDGLGADDWGAEKRRQESKHTRGAGTRARAVGVKVRTSCADEVHEAEELA